jgi:integrase
MANVYERNGGWYISFRWNGKRYRELAGREILKADAEQFLAKRMREVQRQDIYEKPPEPLTFATFADDFLVTDSPDKKSQERSEGVIEMLKVMWKGLDVRAVTPKAIEDYKALRLRTRKPATVARELTVIKRMFRKASEWGKVGLNPAATVTKPRVDNCRVRYLSAPEIKRLDKALPDWLRPLSVFARFTGCRRGEALRLTWDCVDLKRGILTLRQTKTGRDQAVRINATVAALLKSLPSPIDRSQLVFGHEDKPATWMAMKRAWAAACVAASVKDYRWHDQRHQAATELISRGATLYDVQGFLRHRTPAMTARYAHLTDDRQEQTARLLDAPTRRRSLAPKTATGTGEGL